MTVAIRLVDIRPPSRVQFSPVKRGARGVRCKFRGGRGGGEVSGLGLRDSMLTWTEAGPIKWRPKGNAPGVLIKPIPHRPQANRRRGQNALDRGM